MGIALERPDGSETTGDVTFYSAHNESTTTPEIVGKKSLHEKARDIILTDTTEETYVDAGVAITCNGSTMMVAAGTCIAPLSKDRPVVITTLHGNTTAITRKRKNTTTEDDETGPYDMKRYDESRYERGQKFHYEGDHFRGEGGAVVLVNEFLRNYLQEMFDDDDDANDELWDEPARMQLSNLLAPLLTMENAIKEQTGVERKALRELVTYIRRRHAATLRTIEDMKSDSRVSFNALDKIFAAGTKVTFTSDGALHGGIVDRIRLERGMFSKWWSVNLRCIGTDGTKFCTEYHTENIPFFGGSKPFKSLPLEPLIENSDTWQMLKERSEKFMQYAFGHHYLAYEGAGKDTSKWGKMVRASGRIMVDASSFDYMNPNLRRRSSDETKFETILPKDAVICSPFVRGFSFSAKQWLTLDLSNIRPIVFDDKAFDGLVLEPDTKETIEGLVTSFNDTSSLDLITAKSEGLIINLAGPPGVGKTLTCEAVAEKLHLPLYSVTVGELGSRLEDLETNLKNLLEIAARWNAITLIDEADIFMQRRTNLDVVRNGFVGIFLRLLEYHRGLLFLTTNRVESFDEAFKSRISLSVAYPELDEDARRQIWNIFLNRAKLPNSLSIDNLSKLQMNGREIRSLIRLLLGLAIRDGSGRIEQRHFDKVIKVQQYRFAAPAAT